jgi:uracil-DNA glycosylase
MAEPQRQLLGHLDAELKSCRRCMEAGYAITPGAIFSHPPASDVMLIGQAPGVTEVEAQRPFNAGSGRRLFQWLAQAGWSEDEFRSRYVMTAVTKCYPGKAANGKGDRLPSKEEQQLCRPFLRREIGLYRPRLLMPVGGLAIKLFYPTALKLNQIIGSAVYVPPDAADDLLSFRVTRDQQLARFDAARDPQGSWIVPLPHPSGASLWPNKPQNRALIDRAMEILAAIRRQWDL